MVLSLTQAYGKPISQDSSSRLGERSAVKSKFFSILTVCLATSGLLATAQAALGQSAKPQMNAEAIQHLVCVKDAQHFVCEIEKSRQPSSEPGRNQGTVGAAKATESLHSSTATVVPQLFSPAQQESISNILLGFIYFVLPVSLGLGIFLYDKYSGYRSAILGKQIETLERLWKQSI